MEKYFAPYTGDQLAPIIIKGHRLLVLSTTPEDIRAELSVFGGDNILEVDLTDFDYDENTALASLAASIEAGVVLAPPGVKISSIIRDLELELPWVQ